MNNNDLWEITGIGKSYSIENLVIKGARVIDPNLGLDEITDIQIRDNRIIKIGNCSKDSSSEVIEAEGWIVIPGMFDMHVHLREPGFEYKETVHSGCLAAAAGGFTGVACMPNTDPPIDNPGIVNLIKEKSLGTPVDVHPIAAITLRCEGNSLTEFAELTQVGVKGFSDDGLPVASAEMMRLALEYGKMFDSVIIEHCEESSLTKNGVMDEGAVSTALGLPGWPSIAEEMDVFRCISLAEYTGSRIHIAHVSTAGSVKLIRAAKAKGVNISAEVSPHHLTLDRELIRTFDSNYKVNPPLRAQDDINALIKGLEDGTIDAIATDHAPHAADEKEVEFIKAPFGMIGLETALGVIITKLVNENRISLERMIDAFSNAPRRILNLPEVSIQEGQSPNLTLFDPEEEWTVDRDKMISKSKNTPFHDWKLKGRPKGVINRRKVWIRE